MSAVSPLPSSEPPADKRAYEPSMEEILASIRRIIADDQSLPGRIVTRDPEQAPPVKRDLPRPIPPVAAPSVPATVDYVPTEPSVAASFPIPPTPEPSVDSGLAHGPIAAPQFATPDGPVVDDRRPERELEARELEARAEQDRAEQDRAMRERVMQERASDALAGETRVHAQALPSEPVVVPEPTRRESAAPAYATEERPAPVQPVADTVDYDAPIAPAPQRQTPLENPALFSAATDSAVSAAFNMLAASRLADNSDELMTLAREMIRPLLRSWIDDNLPSMVERMVRAEIERVARGDR